LKLGFKINKNRSGESKSIVKQNLEIFEDAQMRRAFEDIYSCAVNVSKCGNFGVVGFSNGNKVNNRFHQQSKHAERTSPADFRRTQACDPGSFRGFPELVFGFGGPGGKLEEVRFLQRLAD